MVVRSSTSVVADSHIYNIPKKNQWKHDLIIWLGWEQRVESVRDRALPPSSASSSVSSPEQTTAMASAAQRHIEKTIDTQLTQIHALNPKLATTFKDHYPRTYQVAACLGRILRWLLSLPLKSAKNIASLLYQMCKASVYAVTHPIKAAKAFLQALVKLALELRKPNIWARIGASIAGTGASQFVSGNPLAATMILVGLSMTGASLFIGTLCELAKKEKFMTNSEAILSYLGKQMAELPETVLTSFLMGLLIRAIQTTPQIMETHVSIQREYANITLEEATKIASAYAQEHGLGKIFYVIIHRPTNAIGFTYWKIENGCRVMQGTSIPLPFVDKEVVTQVIKAGYPSVIPATLAGLGHSITKEERG